MVSIRSARPDDAHAVSILINDAFTPYIDRIGTEPAPMHTDYAVLIDSGTVWVAEDEDQLVGTIVLTPKADHLLLDNLAVPALARGLGIGALLLDFAAEHGRALGVAEVRLYTNAAMTENLDFYPRRGFVETHRSTVDGFDRVFFSKRL
ncbi:GNAT family N-acetyltransferase [Williamsia sp. 1135]|uniref:GNAT family N-acetyltransferase n=1 Tax=Williamsia sp. 1135 TaxID=1889262 RepID=UPI000A110BED|nr:GNAT family N-acetyltransferase [Williamsia sp. 1135]ORM26947.1 GNAT family N-acetyltransferase [Williamsia sp. 1135]